MLKFMNIRFFRETNRFQELRNRYWRINDDLDTSSRLFSHYSSNQLLFYVCQQINYNFWIRICPE